MTMSGYDRVAHVFDVGEQIGDQFTEFFGNGIADRIGDIDGTGSGIDNRRYISTRYSLSERVASIGENSTFSV